MGYQLMLICLAFALSRAEKTSRQDVGHQPYDSTILVLAKRTHYSSETENITLSESEEYDHQIESSKRKLAQHQYYDDRNPNNTRSKVHLFQTNKHYTIKDLETYSTASFVYTRFGGHLEHIELHCNSRTLSKMKYLISDVDQPIETKMISMVIASVAVGCTNTSWYLLNLLLENESKHNFSGPVINLGPQENISKPCDMSAVEHLRPTIYTNEKYKSLYKLLAPALFLSLKCDSIGQNEFRKLVTDFKLRINQRPSNNNRNIRRYLNQRKVQISSLQNLQKENHFLENTTEILSSESRRDKRSIQTDSIEKLFIASTNCSISRPLGETLNPIAKLDCLQLCLDEEGCKSVGYRNDKSQECHLNTENIKDVGTFYSCEKAYTAGWDYFEKKKPVEYFTISNKATANVLEAKPNLTVALKTYTGKDNQLWHWDGDSIRSIQYPTSTLQPDTSEYERIGWGEIYLSSGRSSGQYGWNFENNEFISQYKDILMRVENGSRDEGASVGMSRALVVTRPNQHWSLNFERVYFIITSRYSGKVLEAIEDTVLLGEYDGEHNQLWFWDEENIRSKKYPDKVLGLHMADYEANKWGKVYLHPYTTGSNQKWYTEEDLIVSFYKNLSLDVDQSNEGILVGGSLKHGGTNQKWCFEFARPYFFIINKESGKVLDASSPTTIKLWHYSYTDQQLWFWDGEVLRNKKYADKVIDFHISDYLANNWGNIYLHTFHGEDNQQWKFDNNILLTSFRNLTLAVKDLGQSDSSEIGSDGVNSQKWSLQHAHDFFIISSRLNAKVFDATSADTVRMFSYHGQDHQLWFMDEDNIRSKKFPHKVLDLHVANYDRNGWGNVYLHLFNGGANQQWTMEGDVLISRFKNLRLEIKDHNLNDGAVIGGSLNSEKQSQKWSLNPKGRAYFTIKGVASEKVLDVPADGDLIIYSYNGNDHQLWFWDGDCIRSKKYPRKVLDLHAADYKVDGWGKVYLHEYNGRPNQLWKIQEENIISRYKQLRMDVQYGMKQDGSLVGGCRSNGNNNQKWIISLQQTSRSNCLDKTEAKIYSVIQYIPLIGTFWDLSSSIGYAAAGCTRVAEERAISFGIGAAMDVATVVTGGAAAGATTALKAGVKVGIKFGIKQGTKVTLLVTKQSINNVVKTFAKQGVKSSIKTGFRKGGKLVIREMIVDPAFFLRNVGKISKKILIHPKRTLKGTWKAARSNIEDLKRLKKRLKDDPSFLKLRCKRGNMSCVKGKGKSKLFALESQEAMYKSLVDKSAVSERIERSSRRFMSRQSFENGELSRAPVTVRQQFEGLDSEVDKAEIWAIYQYTKNSGNINSFAGLISTSQPLFSDVSKRPIKEEMAKGLLDSVDEAIDQTDLIQSYLTKHPQTREITVYRWEREIEKYENNQIFTTVNFKSTTTRSERFRDRGLDLTNPQIYPIEMKINLKRSGTKISDLSAFQSQKEYLIPIGTQFRVTVEVPNIDSTVQRFTFDEITQ